MDLCQLGLMQEEQKPLLLQQRCDAGVNIESIGVLLQLPLTAAERQVSRGLRRCSCGREVLLQLPRGAYLQPGEGLAAEAGIPLAVVVAAKEPLLVVCSDDPLGLLQAAYHLGNRHVALEVRVDELRLLADPVLAQMLQQRGLKVSALQAAFVPEVGAYHNTEQHNHQDNHQHHHQHR